MTTTTRLARAAVAYFAQNMRGRRGEGADAMALRDRAILAAGLETLRSPGVQRPF